MVSMEVAEARGWDREAHTQAMLSGDKDRMALTHPSNWMSKDEWEEIAIELALIGIVIVSVKEA